VKALGSRCPTPVKGDTLVAARLISSAFCFCSLRLRAHSCARNDLLAAAGSMSSRCLTLTAPPTVAKQWLQTNFERPNTARGHTGGQCGISRGRERGRRRTKPISVTANCCSAAALNSSQHGNREHDRRNAGAAGGDARVHQGGDARHAGGRARVLATVVPEQVHREKNGCGRRRRPFWHMAGTLTLVHPPPLAAAYELEASTSEVYATLNGDIQEQVEDLFKR